MVQEIHVFYAAEYLLFGGNEDGSQPRLSQGICVASIWTYDGNNLAALAVMRECVYKCASRTHIRVLTGRKAELPRASKPQ